MGLTFTALGGIKNTDSCMGKCLLRAPHNGVHECKLVVFIKMVCYMGNFKAGEFSILSNRATLQINYTQGNNVMDVAGPPWIKDIYGLVWMYMDPGTFMLSFTRSGFHNFDIYAQRSPTR